MAEAFLGTSTLEILLGTLTAVGFILVFFLMGVLLQSFGLTLLVEKEKSFANTFILGFLFVLTVSQFFLVLWNLDCGDVLPATRIWWSIFIILSVFSIVRCRRDIRDIFVSIPKTVRVFFIEKRCGGTYGVLAVVFIALQLIGSLVLYHYDDDDSIYVTTVATNIDVGDFWQTYGPTGEDTTLWEMSQYITNGWYDFLTVVSKSTGIKAAVLMHTIIPTLMIALAYAVLFLFAKLLIKKESQRCLFILFVSIINILNNVSTHTSSSILLMRMHQGKAIFANLIVPVMFCLFLLMLSEVDNKKYLFIMFMANACACALSTSGLVFGAMLTMVFAFVFAIYNKSIKRAVIMLVTIVPNVIFATIYVVERLFEVWGC